MKDFVVNGFDFWSNLATAVVAIYGAVLSTFIYLREQREKRRQIKVTVTNAIPVFASHAGAPVFMIEAANVGSRTAHMSGAGFKIRGRKGGFALFQPQSDVKFPHALEEGKSCRVWVESRDLAEQLKQLGISGTVRLMGYFQDSVSHQYLSKAVRFQIEEWLKTGAS